MKAVDVRTNQEVKIQDTRVDACKKNKAIIVSQTPHPDGWCTPIHTQFIPGGEVNNEYLCEYPDHSISWVDGKHIQMR